jgi:hypothetical protein
VFEYVFELASAAGNQVRPIQSIDDKPRVHIVTYDTTRVVLKALPLHTPSRMPNEQIRLAMSGQSAISVSGYFFIGCQVSAHSCLMAART